MIGSYVNCFTYPNGDYNSIIKGFVRDSGYRAALAAHATVTEKISNDRFALNRISVNEGAALGPRGKFSKVVFACLLEGLFNA